MSIPVMAWVWANAEANPMEILVLLAIADQADDDGHNSWPGQKKLARKCRMSERTLQRVVAGLVGQGQLEVEARKAPGGRGNRYSIPMDRGVSPMRTTRQEVAPQREAHTSEVTPRETPLLADNTSLIHPKEDSPSEVHAEPEPMQYPAWSFPPDRFTEAREAMKPTQEEGVDGPAESATG